MPIKHIQPYAKRNESLFARGDLKKRSQIAIDGDALIYYLYIQSQNFSYGGDTERLCKEARHFFDGLNRFEIQPIVFLPIPSPEIKPEIKMAVFKELADQLAEDPLSSINRAARGFRFCPMHRQAFVQILKELKVNFMFVNGEVAPYLAEYAMENKIPVMGYDSVYLGYDLEFCFIESIYFEDEVQTNARGKQYELRDEVSCLRTTTTKIAESLELTFPQYQYLLRLLPNDYLSEFTELRASFEETGNGKDAKDNMIINFAKFIKENWVDDEAKMNEVILAKQKECF